MTGLLASCLKQVDIIYRNIISVRCSNIMAKYSCNNMIITRFQDSKISAGRLKFFVNLCKKLKIDIDKFMAIVDQNRIDTLDRMEQVTNIHGTFVKGWLETGTCVHNQSEIGTSVYSK